MEPLTIFILSAAIYGFFFWRYHKASDKKVIEMTKKIKELSTERNKKVIEMAKKITELSIELTEKNGEVTELTEKLEKVENENYPILNLATTTKGTIYPTNIFAFRHAFHSDMIYNYSEIRNLIAREFILDKIYKFKTASEKYVYFFFSIQITEIFHFMKKRHIFNSDRWFESKGKYSMILGDKIPYTLYITDNVKDILECGPLMDILSEEDKVSLLFLGEGIEEIKTAEKCFKIPKKQLKPVFKTAWKSYCWHKKRNI